MISMPKKFSDFTNVRSEYGLVRVKDIHSALRKNYPWSLCDQDHPLVSDVT